MHSSSPASGHLRAKPAIAATTSLVRDTRSQASPTGSAQKLRPRSAPGPPALKGTRLIEIFSTGGRGFTYIVIYRFEAGGFCVLCLLSTSPERDYILGGLFHMYVYIYILFLFIYLQHTGEAFSGLQSGSASGAGFGVDAVTL